MSLIPRNTILLGDAAAQLATLPEHSIDCVITSPPYFQLRDYGETGQLGLEPTVDGWVAGLRLVMGEVARVLKPTGSVWLNVGDSYSRHMRYGAQPKSLLLGPERLLLALMADGWIVRNKVVWAKANPMPNSVADRLNTGHEFVYFLVRSPRYYFNLDAIREPHTSRAKGSVRRPPNRPTGWAGPLAGSQDGLRRLQANGLPGHPLGKNPGDVWRLAASNFRGAHFATFPESLVERPLLATCPVAVCDKCGTVDASCACDAVTKPGVVLDPFFGSGTVGVAAQKHGRDWIGVELNPSYAQMARERLGASRRTYERAVA